MHAVDTLPLLARRALVRAGPFAGWDLRAPVPTDPEEHHVAGQYPQQADGKGKPPPDDAVVAQHVGRDDRHFLWDWHSQAAEQERGETPTYVKVSTNSWSASTASLGTSDVSCARPSCSVAEPPTGYAACPMLGLWDTTRWTSAKAANEQGGPSTHYLSSLSNKTALSQNRRT